MRPLAKYLIGGALLAGLAGGAWLAIGAWRDAQALDDLARRSRDGLVFVEGGSFRMGNYQTQFRAPDGTVQDGWAADHSPDQPTADVTLNGFYLSARETSYADFNLYLTRTGQPALIADQGYHKHLPDRAAEITFEEATRYCAWLGQHTGLDLRLPTEAEWEYAARSRGLTPIWGTDDGGFHRGVNVVASGRDLTPDETDPPIGTFPPNPLGLYNLADGLYEWVSDRQPGDPDGAAIFKGGSNFSSAFYERIPDRGIVERRTQASLDMLTNALPEDMVDRLLRQDDPLSPGSVDTTARCALSDTRPPATSGFGQMPGPVTLAPPYSGRE